jgi:putative transposase
VTDYRRNLVPGATWFFTVNLANRRSGLLATRIDALRAAFRYARLRHPFTIDAIVILPDHVHAIWTLPGGDADFPTRWRLIKSHFARVVPPGEPISQSRRRKSERGVWQRRYWEHTIRDLEDFGRHADYIHFNPVKHGHVGRVRDWPYSLFHRMVRLGILAEDWAGDASAVSDDFGER